MNLIQQEAYWYFSKPHAIEATEDEVGCYWYCPLFLSRPAYLTWSQREHIANTSALLVREGEGWPMRVLSIIHFYHSYTIIEGAYCTGAECEQRNCPSFLFLSIWNMKDTETASIPSSLEGARWPSGAWQCEMPILFIHVRHLCATGDAHQYQLQTPNTKTAKEGKRDMQSLSFSLHYHIAHFALRRETGRKVEGNSVRVQTLHLQHLIP